MYERYVKEPKTYEELANLLIDRGLEAEHAHLVTALRNISYYRLSAYWFPFRVAETDNLQAGTTLHLILNRYKFDNELRSLLFSTIHAVEIALRNRIMHVHVIQYGASGYKNIETFPKFSKGTHTGFLSRMYNSYLHSNELFAKHFKAKYGLYDDFPLWMACEMQTFGNVLTMYQGLSKELRDILASELEVSSSILEKWIKAVNYTRNLCAHHNRVWNRRLAVSPRIPKKRLPTKKQNNIEWYEPAKVSPDPENVKIFATMSVVKYILNKYELQNNFAEKLVDLLGSYTEIPIDQMGFPENWLDCPIWL